MDTDSITTENGPDKYVNTSGFGRGENWKGNRNGRPKAGRAITDYVKRKTLHGRKLIDFYLKIALDEAVNYCKVCRRGGESTQNRLIAAARLEDRGFGKAPVVLEDQDGNVITTTFILQRFEGQQAIEQGPPIQTKVIEINPTSEDDHKM